MLPSETQGRKKLVAVGVTGAWLVARVAWHQATGERWEPAARCLCQLPVPPGARPARVAPSKGLLLEQGPLSTSLVVLWGGLG